jgi:hypothetical protein
LSPEQDFDTLLKTLFEQLLVTLTTEIMQVLPRRSLPQDEEAALNEKTRVEWQTSKTRVVVFGAVGSPYTRKVISVLRYQRVPYVFISRGSESDQGFPIPSGPPLLPNVVFVDDWKPMADSTFILREVEKRRLSPSGRSLRPPKPHLALLDSLLEDFADEVSFL